MPPTSQTRQSSVKYARRCVVAIRGSQQFLGSGFFVAKQVVVTCSHVLPRSDDRIRVEWLGTLYDVEVLAREPADFPDVAFLGLKSPLDHQVLHLEEKSPQPGSEVVILGNSRYTPERQPAEDVVRMTVTGQHGRFIKLSGGRLVHGLSGSPVIDSSRVALEQSSKVDGSGR